MYGKDVQQKQVMQRWKKADLLVVREKWKTVGNCFCLTSTEIDFNYNLITELAQPSVSLLKDPKNILNIAC